VKLSTVEIRLEEPPSSGCLLPFLTTARLHTYLLAQQLPADFNEPVGRDWRSLFETLEGSRATTALKHTYATKTKTTTTTITTRTTTATTQNTCSTWPEQKRTRLSKVKRRAQPTTAYPVRRPILSCHVLSGAPPAMSCSHDGASSEYYLTAICVLIVYAQQAIVFYGIRIQLTLAHSPVRVPSEGRSQSQL